MLEVILSVALLGLFLFAFFKSPSRVDWRRQRKSIEKSRVETLAEERREVLVQFMAKVEARGRSSPGAETD